jgi:DNA-binding transcriptional MerR regulator
MQIIKERYSITELSEELKTTDHTLRFYEKEFGLKIPKDKRGRRFYNSPHANIMYKIKCMRDEGLEIKAIKKIIELDKNNSLSSPLNDYFQNNQLDQKDNSNYPPITIEDDTFVIEDGTSGAFIDIDKSALMSRDTTEIELFIEQLRDVIKQSVTSEIDILKQQIENQLTRNISEIDNSFEKNIRLLVEDIEQQFNETRGTIYTIENERNKKWYKNLFKKDRRMSV